MRMFLSSLLLALAWAAQAQTPPLPEKSKVYYAMDSSSVGPARAINQRVVQRMVDSLICAATSQAGPAAAWRSLVSPQDIVGIKVTAVGTQPEVAAAIAQGLREAGVPAKNIIVWDRNYDELVQAGYSTDGSLYTLQGIDPRKGYDPKAVVTAPIIGKLIWGDSQFGRKDGVRLTDILSNGDQLSSNSYYATVLTKVTKVINVPCLMDSFMTGINGAMVNMTLSNIDNWRRFAKASSEGEAYLADVYADPMIHDKVVITILDALFLQYAGGPFSNPNFLVDNFTIFAGKDVVALDATALRLIDEVRKSNKLPSAKNQAAWIQGAADIGLGNYSESRIEMIRIGSEGLR